MSNRGNEGGQQPLPRDSGDARMAKLAAERLRRIRSGEDGLLTEEEFFRQADGIMAERQRQRNVPHDGNE